MSWYNRLANDKKYLDNKGYKDTPLEEIKNNKAEQAEVDTNKVLPDSANEEHMAPKDKPFTTPSGKVIEYYWDSNKTYVYEDLPSHLQRWLTEDSVTAGDNDEAGNEEYKELLKELNSKVVERIQNDYNAFPKTERDCE